jgi:hypothetical protein
VNRYLSKQNKYKYKLPGGVYRIYGDSRIHLKGVIEEIDEHRRFFWLLPNLIYRLYRTEDPDKKLNSQEVKVLLRNIYPTLATKILRYLNLNDEDRSLIMEYRPIKDLYSLIQEFFEAVEAKVELLKKTRPMLVLKSMRLFRKTILVANKLAEENKAYMDQRNEQEQILDILDVEVPGIKFYVLTQMEKDIEVPIYMRSDSELSKLYTKTIITELIKHKEESESLTQLKPTLPEVLEEKINKQVQKQKGNYINLAGSTLTERDQITRHPLVGAEIVRERVKGSSIALTAQKLGLEVSDVERFWKYYESLSDAAKLAYNKRNVFNWHARLEEHFNDLWDQINSLPEYTEDGEINELSQDLCLAFMEEVLTTLDSYQKILATVANSSSVELFSYHVDQYLQEHVLPSKLPVLLNKLNEFQRTKLA